MTTLAISVGCPSGIGPEVTVAAVADLAARASTDTFILVGDRPAIEAAAAVRRVDLARLHGVRVEPVSELAEAHRRPGKPGIEAGRAQLAAIDRALALVVSGQAHALVTGPVSKPTIAATGAKFTGHTEYLAEKTSTHTVAMFFVGPTLRTGLVTTHLPLRAVADAITRSGVAKTIGLCARALWRDFRVDHPRIGVCGLNPHAGDEGLLGREEIDVIAPAVEDARAMLSGIATIEGPLPAEAAFRVAKGHRAYDCIVAMYHDQATIPSKLVDFGDSVNVTLGLPIIRTSVDHGTAYDLAFTGRGDARSMRAALVLARDMAAARGQRGG